ncbi:hypothetical protein IMG5_073100 [Ichthyophthirius multifiliis]|uniref:chorismate synthase n=1 Tax=Ichthyophthirius multifiliis TaxID=5932 RepID=G0QPY8_ICHMU|nr:hypothetical protein IMG5_073100 [Ichthyophthirius multifiliis]EGR32715.1 hypothetical protein IMG5_073100 [Ichthyophthirius multifiliis]|eukprot:XP_004036701.1 hypothetical protein IMG5_073100 [Ichthyophthirius multifiliis]
MSSFGKIYKVTTFGESHSKAVGCSVENFPPNHIVDINYIQKALNRRKPNQSSLTTSRDELDQVDIICGLQNNTSLGSPIAFLVHNKDQIPSDYIAMDQIPRPGHADYTYLVKYGIKAQSGGGRSSARETIGRICGGALADIILEKQLKMNIFSFVSSVGNIEIPSEIIQEIVNEKQFILNKDKIDQNGTFNVYIKNEEDEIYENNNIYFNKNGEKILNKLNINEYKLTQQVNIRCPHQQTGVKMIELIKQIKKQKDSIGGTIICVIQNPPIGLGEPCFNKLNALLAHAIMSIPATKGFEIGSGFEGTKLKGSQHNDVFFQDENKQYLSTKTNHSGGTLGGISNGQNIYFKVAFKPVSTIGIPQNTCSLDGKDTVLEAKGRHDPCVLPRAPPIVEAMASITILDSYLMLKANSNQFW